MSSLLNNQRGLSQFGLLLVIVAIFGILFFLVYTSIAPFKNGTSEELNQKAASLAATPAPNGVVLAINPNVVSLSPNQTTTLSLDMLAGSDKVTAAEVHVTFDPTKLQAQSITAGTFLPVVLVPGSFDNTAGTATITLGSQPTAPVTGTGTLATIVFKAIGSGVTSVAYASTSQTASVGKTGTSLVGTAGSTVTIAAPTITPTATSIPTVPPTATPTPTPTPSPTVGPKMVTLSMNPTTTSLNGPTGQTVTESLNLNAGTDQVTAAELHLTFNPSIVKVQSITAGTFLPVVLTPGAFDNTAGTASITLGSQPTTPATGTGTLATVVFAPATTTGGSSAISYAATTQTASVGRTGNSLVSSTGATIAVNWPTPTPTPVVTPTPVPTPTPTASPTPVPTPTPTPAGSLPPQPVVSLPSCIPAGYSGSGVTISWGSVTPAVTFVDVSTDPTFASFSNKAVASGALSVTAPAGFLDFPAATTALVLNPNTTYYTRSYNGFGTDGHSSVVSFAIQACATPTPVPTPTPTPKPTVTPTGIPTATPTPIVTPTPTPAPTPTPVQTGSITGLVTSVTGSPLKNVQVCIVDSANNCISLGGNATVIYTNRSGLYTFTNLTPKSYTLKYKRRKVIKFQTITVVGGVATQAPRVTF